MPFPPQVCKNDLLQLDFESIMRYFRVQMPKRCRSKEASLQIMNLACRIKVKKLKKYEQDFIALKGMFVFFVRMLRFG